MTEKKKNIPELRFPEFDDKWTDDIFGSYYNFIPNYSFSRSDLNYDNGKIQNIHYGDIHSKFYNNFRVEKEQVPFINENRMPKDINEEHFCRIGDLIIADASEDYNDVGKTIEIRSINNSKILSGLHTFLARPKNQNIEVGYMGYYLQTWYLRIQRMRLATGISVLGISKNNFRKIRVKIPSLNEQKKIASFLTSVDERIQQLTKKKELLEKYKKGVMQKIFFQEIRFKDDEGKGFQNWQNRKMSTVLVEHKENSTGEEEVYSVSVHKGLINQIEHLGRSFAAKTTGHYNLVKPKDIVYTKSPTGDFPFGIIKQSKIEKSVIVSPLYGVFTPETPSLGYILDAYFESKVNVHNYLHSIIQKGAKNTINITNDTFLSKKLYLPVSKEEQQKIADFIKSIDARIEITDKQIEKIKQFKKGLLQKMFV